MWSKKRNKKFNMIIFFSNFIIQGEHCIVNIITLGELFSFKDIRDLFFLCKRFCRYTSSRVETHNGLTDLNSLLATIAQTGVDREKLQKVYDANFSVITNSVRHFARHTFLLALEELSSPSWLFQYKYGL